MIILIVEFENYDISCFIVQSTEIHVQNLLVEL